MTGVSRVYLSLVSPAGIHNSRERAGSSTPLSRPMSPRSRSRGTRRIEGKNDSRKIYRRYRPRMHVAHERPTFWPNFEVITKRRSRRPVARPYCRSPLSLSLSLCSPCLVSCSPRSSISSFGWSSFSRPRGPRLSRRSNAKINAT